MLRSLTLVQRLFPKELLESVLLVASKEMQRGAHEKAQRLWQHDSELGSAIVGELHSIGSAKEAFVLPNEGELQWQWRVKRLWWAFVVALAAVVVQQ